MSKACQQMSLGNNLPFSWLKNTFPLSFWYVTYAYGTIDISFNMVLLICWFNTFQVSFISDIIIIMLSVNVNAYANCCCYPVIEQKAEAFPLIMARWYLK